MDIRDGHKDQPGFVLHKIDMRTGAILCRCARTFKGWRIEPEVDGQREAWRAEVRDHRSCYNCGVALERLAEA